MLSEHVVVTTVRCPVADAAVVAVAFAMGYEPAASALDRLGAIGLLVLPGLAAGPWCAGTALVG
ncbi:hypothetical protein ACWD5V_07860 [Streptomyces sp. NPDC002523]